MLTKIPNELLLELSEFTWKVKLNSNEKICLRYFRLISSMVKVNFFKVQRQPGKG